MSDTQQSLDAMQEMLNLVLAEVGRAFQLSKRESRAQTQLDTRIAIARLEEKFQCALDNIEEDIVRAKSILYRDLQQLREKKAAAAQPEPNSVHTPEKLSKNVLQEAAPSMVSVADFGAGASQSQFDGDDAPDSTLDRLQKSVAQAQHIVRSPNIAGKEIQSAKSADKQFTQTSLSDNILILPKESPFESPAETKDQPKRSSTAEASKNEASNAKDVRVEDEVPVTNAKMPSNEAPHTDGQETSTDLDSLFEETNSNSNTKQSENQDFADVDFTAGGDFTFPTTTAPTNNTDDLDSLMPGIESYAAAGNQSEDFNMLDFPTNTDSAAGNRNANADMSMDSTFDFPGDDNNAGSGDAGGGGSSNNMDLGISNESNFDDLLDGMEFDNAEHEGDAGMEHGDFDDAFFGLG